MCYNIVYQYNDNMTHHLETNTRLDLLSHLSCYARKCYTGYSMDLMNQEMGDN